MKWVLPGWEGEGAKGWTRDEEYKIDDSVRCPSVLAAAGMGWKSFLHSLYSFLWPEKTTSPLSLCFRIQQIGILILNFLPQRSVVKCN